MGSQCRQSTGPSRYSQQGLEESSTKCRFPLVVLINAIFRSQYFPAAWNNARVFSILKPRKDPELPSCYRPSILLDTPGKLFEKILLSRILCEVGGRGLLRNEQMGSDQNTAHRYSSPSS
jgi:hypothetical protein